jgi:hypothetical protein
MREERPDEGAHPTLAGYACTKLSLTTHLAAGRARDERAGRPERCILNDQSRRLSGVFGVVVALEWKELRFIRSKDLKGLKGSFFV